MRRILTALCQKLYYTFFRERFNKQICFVHLPKCGGKSFDEALWRFDPFSHVSIKSAPSFEAATLLYQLDDPTANDFDQVLRFREYILLYWMYENVRFISGHVSFSETAYQTFRDRYAFITLLRHPVKRWISLYFYHRYKTIQTPTMLEDDIQTFLQSQRGKNQGYRYIHMLGGIRDDGDYRSPQAIAQAKANLHKFVLVGCLEHLGVFQAQFQQTFGVKLKFPRKNRNPKSRAFIDSIVTDDIVNEVTAICQPDIELYYYALENFVKTS